MSLPFQLALGNNTPTTVVSGFGRIDMPDPTFLDIHGGTPGQFLATDGNAGLYWANATSSGSDAPNDAYAYGRHGGSWAQVVQLGGDTMTGLLTLFAAPTQPLHAATKAYVDSRTAVSSDAPSDGFAYARLNAAWARALPLAGGTMTGPLLLAADPAAAMQAATKNYVDSRTTTADGVSIVGNGTTVPFAVAALDGGTY